MLARKWESALLVNVDNLTLRRILDNPEAMAAVERIEGWRSLGDNIIETIINRSERVKELKKKGHPAKQIFQAIRIEVNDELGAADESIQQAALNIDEDDTGPLA